MEVIFIIFGVIAFVMILISRLMSKSFFWSMVLVFQTVFGILKSVVFFIIGYRPVSSKVFGSAKLMGSLKRARLLSASNDGLLLENRKRISEEKSFKNLLLVAGTGWGKSIRYVLPNLLCPHSSQPSFVVTDPSGELWERSAGYLHSIGYILKRLNFSDPSQTLGYNPLATMTHHREVEHIADVLVRSSYQDRGGETFWNDKAREVLAVFMKCLLHSSIDSKYRNLGNVRYLLNAFGSDGKPLHTFFAQTSDAFLFNEIKGFIAQDEKVRQGAISTAKGALKLFSNMEVCTITATNSINFKEVRDKPVVLYVSIPEQEEELFQPLLNLFYTELFYFLMELPKPDQKAVYVLLDEGGNLTIPGFPKLISVLRKRKVSISLILQSLSQLEAKYGRNGAITILDNLNNQIYAPGMNLQTAQMLETLIGKTTVTYRQPSNSDWDLMEKQKHRQYVGRSLFTADELRRLEYPLFLSENEEATLLKGMLPFFENMQLKKRANIKVSMGEFTAFDSCEFLKI